MVNKRRIVDSDIQVTLYCLEDSDGSIGGVVPQDFDGLTFFVRGRRFVMSVDALSDRPVNWLEAQFPEDEVVLD